MALALFVLGARLITHLWCNEIRPRLSGTHIKTTNYAVERRVIDVMAAIAEEQRHPAAKSYFVGSSPSRRLGRREELPCRLTEIQRSMHLQVLGQTGSGKTASVLFVLALQDMLRGKGVIVIDFKGSSENVTVMRNLAALAGRSDDLRIFSPTHPESHTYNPLYLRARSATDKGGDPLAVAERVFSVFKPEMQELYYKNLGDSFFRSVICALHGIVDHKGESFPFTFEDVLEVLQNPDTLQWVLGQTTDKNAARNLYHQLKNLGRDAGSSLMGLQNMVQKYCDLPLVNATQPDIIIDEVFERNLIAYFQLPANFYANLTVDVGRIVLQDIQQAGARRQVYRAAANQTPIAVHIDEFSNLATAESASSIISSLNKLRDAHVQFTLAHQILADLEAVSPEFANGIWGNTRTKIILAQQDPKLAEHLSKSLGTKSALKFTARHTVSDLAVSLNAGEHSVREVEEFNLHPNAIKQLAPVGQAYLVHGSDFRPLNLGCLPKRLFELEPNAPLVPRRAQDRGLRLRDLVNATAPASEDQSCLH
ncbi:MAG: type IV secretion system DNA-binding domain-containing protein [Deltaproteobacteria bacterium]|nr:type IV secretion system DNA-binding domain-containing protein [Deltaproteobacteria bacterium]